MLASGQILAEQDDAPPAPPSPPSPEEPPPQLEGVRPRQACAWVPEVDALRPTAQSAEPFELWPAHLQVLQLWTAVATQWREGMAGRTGLDYAGVHATMHILGVPRARRARLLDELRAVEGAALDEWRRRRAGSQFAGAPGG